MQRINLQHLRKVQGVTQIQLAELTGYPQGFISQIENGKAHKEKLDQIRNEAGQEPVQHVAQGAAQHHHEADPAQGGQAFAPEKKEGAGDQDQAQQPQQPGPAAEEGKAMPVFRAG